MGLLIHCITCVGGVRGFLSTGPTPIGVITGRHSYENRFKVSKGRDSRKSAMKGRCFRRSYVLEGSYRSRGG